ncbi:MAG: hypothetical protein U9Q72_00275 [Patescibacteria group bacterium]|nr:hypothetical protein [Patescibacteria group bacterium]
MSKKEEDKGITFLGLPEEEQDKMVKRAIREANNDQRKVEREYQKKFKELEPVGDC